MVAPSSMEQKQKIYPTFRKFKVRCQAGVLRGAEPIILEFLHSLTEFVDELHGPNDVPFRDTFQELFKTQLAYLTEDGECSLPLPMYNVVQQIQTVVSDANPDATFVNVRQSLRKWMEEFYCANFEGATNNIIDYTLGKVHSLQATSILTFGWSPIVESTLLELAKRPIANLNIKVIDGNPESPGKKLVRTLINRKIRCTYGKLNSLGDELPHTHLVLLGANAVMSNGNLLAARGTAVVVYLARSYNIPVLAMVRSYHFTDKVRTIEKSATTLDTEALETISAEMISALVSATSAERANFGRRSIPVRH